MIVQISLNLRRIEKDIYTVSPRFKTKSPDLSGQHDIEYPMRYCEERFFLQIVPVERLINNAILGRLRCRDKNVSSSAPGCFEIELQPH